MYVSECREIDRRATVAIFGFAANFRCICTDPLERGLTSAEPVIASCCRQCLDELERFPASAIDVIANRFTTIHTDARPIED